MKNKQQNRGIYRTLVGILVLGFAAALVLAVFSIVQLQQYKEDSAAVKRDYEQQIAELKELQTNLESQIEEKAEEIAAYQAEQDAKAAKEASRLAEEQAQAALEAKHMSMYEFRQLSAGEIISGERIKTDELSRYFVINEIAEGDAVYNRINGKSYRANNNIGLSDLRYLQMIHYNFDHEIQTGEMIVNAAVAEDVVNIFRELFMIGYEVNSMYLIDNFWTGDGDSSDTASIQVNNTSAFCYRTVTGGSTLSNHAYGRAIDINPQQNPYITIDSSGNASWHHDNATPYVDRSCGDPHVIVNGDACYEIFAKYGFSWGGNWANPIDYQHFEKPN